MSVFQRNIEVSVINLNLHSEKMGATVYAILSTAFFKTLSASQFTALLATLGFGSMALGIGVYFLSGYYFAKAWSAFWKKWI